MSEILKRDMLLPFLSLLEANSAKRKSFECLAIVV